MNDNDILKFNEKFVEDSLDLLSELENNLLELEENTENKELIESVFRTLHTLKGAGGMFGFDLISEYTHSLENIFDAIRNERLKLSTDIFDVTLRSVDHLRNLLKDSQLESPENQINHQLLSSVLIQIAEKYVIKVKPITTAINTVSLKTEGVNSWLIIIQSDESFILRGIRLLHIFRDLTLLGNLHYSKHHFSILPQDNSINEFWEIILVSDCQKDDIEDVLLLIQSDCKINKLVEGNIFEEDFLQEEKDPLNKIPSIVEYAEAISRGQKIEIKTESENKAELNQIKQPLKISQDSFAADHISVSVQKLDQLMYFVSELVILKSELQNASERKDLELLQTKIDKVEKLTKQLRNVTLSIRLVQLRELTTKFKRLIRDLSQSLGKKIELVTQGEDVELDKNMIDLLSDPLMHLIRNCIDHGIEMPEDRIAKGKSEIGIIKISAFQSGNFVFIQISDDGAGINKSVIQKKALEKNLIHSETEITDKELYDLIFLPGFSTAEHLTQVSGRGVGMDVVKRRITDLRGEIEIETEVELGTSFTIKLQQTLTIMDSLLIRTGDSYFTIPIEEVEICSQELHSEIAGKQNFQIRINDELIPFVHLREIFKIKGTIPETEKIIVIQKQNEHFAIIADSIMGSYQAVLKPVGTIFKNQKFIAGASVMGDGNLAIMLDTSKLLLKINEQN